jgi:polyphosphate kinase
VATSPEVCALLMRELELGPDDMYTIEGPLDLSGLWAVYDLPRPELKDDAWVPVTQPRLTSSGDEAEPSLFDVVRDRDLLVHHPYDSFTTSVEAFIEQAADDPKVLAIKQTLYRTSGDSPIVQALIHAAERGKQVAALVELKARFDEQANIAWARALEQAGVHVVYGLVGLKTHTKTALVVRDEDGGVRRYCHIGTGNYNSSTARMYEDLGLLTTDPDLGADLTDLFNFLTGYSRRTEYRKLLVAPLSLRSEMMKLIERESARGDQGRLVWKLNNLVDPLIIDALYDASQQGVRIDCIVRGICCLRPGVPGLSDNIRVRSIVGRYLEHSRIYFFGASGEGGPSARTVDGIPADLAAAGPAVPDGGEYYIGSADMMPRNLDRRVEAVVPVLKSELCLRLKEILEVEMADDVLAWELQGDGTWRKIPPAHGFNAQRHFQDMALERARRRREPDPLNALGRAGS